MQHAIHWLADALPDQPQAFDGSEYPMPVMGALLGRDIGPDELREWLIEADDLKSSLEPVALAAEMIESIAADRDAYFMDDASVRGAVFGGAKWRAGWVLLAGSKITDETVELLKANQYMIFSAARGAQADHALPERETGAIYYGQLMVRYGMTWGMVPPGDDHELGHFLEADMPGAMVVLGEIGPVEGLVLLSLMKLGCPAIVGPDFAYDLGPKAVARDDAEVLEALLALPNMRVRSAAGETVSLPEPADPAHVGEEVNPERTLRGLFQLRPGATEGGVSVEGDVQSGAIAILIDVDDPDIDPAISAHLEAQALRYGSYLPGVRTRRDDAGEFTLELATGVELDAALLGDVIVSGLKCGFPRLGRAGVRIGLGEDAVQAEAKDVREFVRMRDAMLAAESEANVDEFDACIDCQPFALNHVCVVTPDRPPMCGKSWLSMKAQALWGGYGRPWTRREKMDEDLRRRIPKGAPIDADAGEWAGVNEAVRDLTNGGLDRVRIHAVCDAPHTSCGCFGALAFEIPGTDWVGVMHRGYEGEAPGGLTWSILANRAGGKQCPGVTGISLAYLKSPKFLGGEGGPSAVKWATVRAKEVLAAQLPPRATVATEDDATTMDELRAFLEVGQG